MANVYPNVYPPPVDDGIELPLLGSELVCVVTPLKATGLVELAPLARPLIPDRAPEAGEQYRFHFDMTKCIGCKCCVVACNEQNGNPAAIHWRRVGELEGGYYPQVQRHHLSMGCNHCLEPSCLIGCPVEAYHKDPATGVVVHSADTCIGCQYCTWNCSYGVPQYNAERGVVGKCDLCHNRLSDGMAPACVAACPEGAIAVEIVRVDEWRRDYLSANAPGLPSADDSISTTRVTLPDDLPPDTGRVDTQRIVPEHPHWPLVFMLVLTQLSAGAFGALWLLDLFDRGSARWIAVLGSLALAAMSLGTATLHLGRPAYAWRALKGLRRSWLSREVLMLSIFAGVASMYAGAVLLHLPGKFALGFVSVLCGLAGVLCSARIYMVRARPAWSSRYTLAEFFSTALLLGPLFVWALDRETLSGMDQTWLARGVVAGAAAQLIAQVLKFLWLSQSDQFELRASALLLSGRLKTAFLARLGVLIAAGIVLPLVAQSQWMIGAAFVLALVGEWLGRWLFFVSVVPKNVAAAFAASGRAAA
ncbi:MAG TPA: DmsC/YnfH family molybdoenzyme membrane anchor subunit [Bryobacteraceae bacterium]|nr:DmsC/YnfH family molybdoenzyme membrane anchor subunit [Bryobacteraceae bacterium]